MAIADHMHFVSFGGERIGHIAEQLPCGCGIGPEKLIQEKNSHRVRTSGLDFVTPSLQDPRFRNAAFRIDRH